MAVAIGVLGLLATLVGILGDIELAEDAAAEAFAIAAERWPRDGEPANPTGWLITTARNRAIDQLRRQQVLAAKTTLLARDLEAGPQPPEALMDDDAAIPDERLELIFTCCHPALALEAQVALTLRTLGGPGPSRRRHPSENLHRAGATGHPFDLRRCRRKFGLRASGAGGVAGRP